MPKKPYIPLYVGDWVKDTDCISLEAEGALLKFIFKMWESEIPGSLSIRFSQIAILLKKPEEIARKIVQELHENRILDIEFIGDSAVKLESRRMLREARISQINSENGSQGGRPVKKGKAKVKRIKSDSKAKVKRNADIDIDNEYDNEIDSEIELEKGGVGEKEPKKRKQEIEIKNPFTPEFYRTAWQDWKQFKLAKNPIKPESESMALKKLFKLSGGDEATATQIIEESIAQGWEGLYKLKAEPESPGHQKPKPESPTQTDDITRIIDEFNALTQSDYNAADEAIRGYLAGRLMDGCQLQDMLDVIALKAVQWGSGDSRKYLKFHILFKPEKYPGYVQEVKDAKSGKIKVINPNESAYDRIQRKIDAALGRTQFA